MYSFRDALCETEARDVLAKKIIDSLQVLDLKPACYSRLVHFSTSQNIVAKNYIILFGIVRLVGLWETMVPLSNKRSVEEMKMLYEALGNHLIGADKKVTDVHDFVVEWTSRIEWLGK